jgi:hypothetical protein
MVGMLIAGAVVVESVFAWPGIGRLLVVSVANRHLPVLHEVDIARVLQQGRNIRGHQQLVLSLADGVCASRCSEDGSSN